MFRKRLAIMGMAFVVALSVAACGGDEARGDASPSLGGVVSIDIEDIAHGEGESEEESEEVKESDKEEDASVEVAKTETSKDEKAKSKDSGNETSSNKSSRNGSNSGNGGGSGSGSSSNSSTNTPAKQECTHDWVADYKTVHHDAVTHVVHHPAGSHTVHHDAVTHTVHHDAVTHTVHHDAEGYWTQRQWIVTQAASQGALEYHCECGFFSTDGSVVANHRESKLLEGDFNHGKSWTQYGQGTPEQGYWKEPEWIQTKAAWDEVVVDKAAYDEVVVDKAAWDETVIDKKAWDETVVDKAAYDEKVINGYHCSKCGKTK